MPKFLHPSLAATLALAGLLATTPRGHAAGPERDLLLRNESGAIIVAFYASNVGTDEWRGDILGNDVLGPGYRVWINLDDASGYCRFDLKTVFDDGSYVVRRDVDVCATHLYRITS